MSVDLTLIEGGKTDESQGQAMPQWPMEPSLEELLARLDAQFRDFAKWYGIFQADPAAYGMFRSVVVDALVPTIDRLASHFGDGSGGAA